MDIRVFITARELEEKGLLVAYIQKFHTIPINKDERISMTLEHAQKIGLSLENEPATAPKRRTKKAK